MLNIYTLSTEHGTNIFMSTVVGDRNPNSDNFFSLIGWNQLKMLLTRFNQISPFDGLLDDPSEVRSSAL